MNEVDAAVERSLAAAQIPGAVVCIGNSREVTYLKAYGRRAVVPAIEEMRVDTIFDISSCTKSIATAASIMILADRGDLDLQERVARYLPTFAVNGKGDITIANLLLHIGGLQRDNDRRDYADGIERSFERIYSIAPAVPPRSMFGYSDLGHIVLGKLVEVIGGRPLDLFARDNIFAPLSMHDTLFAPSDSLRPRCAPTDRRGGQMVRGEVRDPRARSLGGVAGHAGLFSTAADLGSFCRMILRKGELNGQVVLSEAAITAMTTPRKLPGGGSRAYGFDVDTAYGVDTRGRRFERGSTFGHSGDAGVSFWIDPVNDCFFVLMSNSVHPDGQGRIREFRHAVSTQIGYSILGKAKPAEVRCGVQLFRRDGRLAIGGAAIGYYTNRGEEAPIELRDAKHVRADDDLDSLDVLIINVQDVGARFFGELANLRAMMERAAQRKVEVIILDRPNPNSGMIVGGPVATNPECINIFGPIPTIHGLTIGELATLINAESRIGCPVQVIPMQGWQRTMDWEETGLPWVAPSADIRSPETAAAYCAIGLLEEANVSLGRGTESAYRFVGAPWIDGPALVAALRKHNLPGLSFAPGAGDPSSVQLEVTERRTIQPVRTGITIAWELSRLFGSRFDIEAIRLRLCNDESFSALLKVPDPAMLLQLWRLPLQAYRRLRDKYLIYQ